MTFSQKQKLKRLLQKYLTDEINEFEELCKSIDYRYN